jgi:outer membrane receptor protein involved in Fe transport
VELGNPDLVPEQGNFVDAGIKVNASRIQLTGNVFLNYLSSMITMVPADSVSFSAPEESGSTAKVHARRYENIDKALLSGFEFNVDWWLYPAGVAYGQLSYVRGDDRNTGDHLPQIAPLNGVVGIRHRITELGTIDVRSRFFGSQNKVAEGELPSEGYVLVDCFLTSKPIQMQGIQLQLSAGVENLTNTSYRSHLSTNRGNWMLEPGRNMKFKLSVTW